MSNQDEEPRERQSLGAELIIPVLAAGFAVYYLSTVWHLHWEANAAAIGIIGAMAVLLVILMIRYARSWLAGTADLGFRSLVEPRGLLPRRLGILTASFAFIFLMPYLGFTLAVFVFLVVGMLIMAGWGRLRIILPIAFGVAALGYVLFIAFIQVRFPRGPIERLLAGLI